MIAQVQNCLFENFLNNIVKIGYQIANAKATIITVKLHSELPVLHHRDIVQFIFGSGNTARIDASQKMDRFQTTE